jgi:hypothetical protein
MKGRAGTVFFVLLTLWVSHGLLGQAATPPGFSVSKADGGPVRTDLGYGIAVNKGSTLHRQALTVHDARIGAQLNGEATVQTVYTDRDYQLKATFSVLPTEPISAIEVRFILFDVFGGRMKILSTTEVMDLPAGQVKALDARWPTYENEVSEFLASLAFVAKVRTQTGQVIVADLSPVLAEANKFAKKLTIADLEPKVDPKP